MTERRKLRSAPANGHGNGNGSRRRHGNRYQDSYRPEYADTARKLCELGHTDFEIAKFLEINTNTLYKWQHRYPEFKEALTLGKKLPDERVKRSLYHRAVGYSYDSEELFKLVDEDEDGNKTERIHHERVVKHVPPDTTADIFWMKNRDRENWRESGNHNGLDDGGEVSIQDAQARLLARVFGVLGRIGGGPAEDRETRVIEAKPERRS